MYKPVLIKIGQFCELIAYKYTRTHFKLEIKLNSKIYILDAKKIEMLQLTKINCLSMKITKT